MEELTAIELFTRRILYFIGWLIKNISEFFAERVTIASFKSPLIYLSIGLFLSFAALHIFKRILRKG